MPETIRIARFGIVNAYLVREDDGLTLIDTTVTKSGKAIRAAAADAGGAIVRIALTHAHGDHVGALDELATAPSRSRRRRSPASRSCPPRATRLCCRAKCRPPPTSRRRSSAAATRR